MTGLDRIGRESFGGRIWGVLRYFIAAILIAAVILKTIAVAKQGFGEGLFQYPLFLFFEIALESAVAVLLLVNFHPKHLWLLTTALFAVFFIFALTSLLTGQDSCHCFGNFKVRPICTVFLDAIILAFLFCCRKIRLIRNEFSIKKALLIGLLWIAVMLPVLFIFASVEKENLSQLGTVYTGIDGHKTIQLKPDVWLEGECPLLEWALPEECLDQLTTGDWTVVVYRADCPDCQEVLANLKERGVANVVCVEIPPYGEKNIVPEGFVHLRLPDTVTWVVKTPLVIESVRYSGKKQGLSKISR